MSNKRRLEQSCVVEKERKRYLTFNSPKKQKVIQPVKQISPPLPPQVTLHPFSLSDPFITIVKKIENVAMGETIYSVKGYKIYVAEGDFYTPEGEHVVSFRHSTKKPSKEFKAAERNLKRILLHNPTQLKRKEATQNKKANSFVVGNIRDRFFKRNKKEELGPVKWNKEQSNYIESLTPLFADMSKSFESVMPTESSFKQGTIPPDMRLQGTKQFTSSVINYDLQCSTHKDKDDFAFGEKNELRAGYCMVKIFKDKGSTGGYLLFPEFKIALDIRNRGFAIFQAWKYVHANSMIQNEEGAHRISIVAYANRSVIETCQKKQLASKEIKPIE